MTSRWVDRRPIATRHSGYPAWVLRRLDGLDRAFIDGDGLKHPEVTRRAYSRMGGGSGCQILPHHLDWIARSMLVAGPHAPRPPTVQLPGLVEALNCFQQLHPLLETWLTDLAAAHLRRHGWDSLCRLNLANDYLEKRILQRYWDWLIGVVSTYRPFEYTLKRSEEELASARIVRSLFRDTGLAGLCERAARWIRSPPEVRAPLVETGVGAWLPLLDDKCGVFVDGVAVACLQNRTSITFAAAELEVDPGRIWEAVLSRVYLTFSLWDSEAALGALANLVFVERHGWHVAELKGKRGAKILQGSRLWYVARRLCEVLDETGESHPLAAEYVSGDSEAARWRRVGRHLAEPDKMGMHVAGVGNDASCVLRTEWRRVMRGYSATAPGR
ncbi:hypothetical protein GCM10028862_03200 [Luteimonas pelagia]